EYILDNREDLAGIVVASADGQNSHPSLEELAAEGIPVTVLGFHEHVSWAIGSDSLAFVDLAAIPGVFRDPLPRITLAPLPPEGAWLRPLRSLSALVEH